MYDNVISCWNNKLQELQNPKRKVHKKDLSTDLIISFPINHKAAQLIPISTWRVCTLMLVIVIALDNLSWLSHTRNKLEKFSLCRPASKFQISYCAALPLAITGHLLWTAVLIIHNNTYYKIHTYAQWISLSSMRYQWTTSKFHFRHIFTFFTF